MSIVEASYFKGNRNKELKGSKENICIWKYSNSLFKNMLFYAEKVILILHGWYQCKIVVFKNSIACKHVTYDIPTIFISKFDLVFKVETIEDNKHTISVKEYAVA